MLLPFDIPMPKNVEFDELAMKEDVTMARISILKAHVARAPDVRKALLAFHAALLEESRLVLMKLFDNDMKRIKDYEFKLLNHGTDA